MFKLGKVLLTSGSDEHVNSVAETFMNLQARIVDAQDLLAGQFDDTVWVFIDWFLPVMAGIQLVRLLRQNQWGKRANLVMVLPSDDDEMRARALSVGADDYFIGPLTPQALVARLKTYQGAMLQPDEPVIRIGSLTVDTAAYSARFEGRRIPLNSHEFRLLAHFARHPNRVFTRADLIGMLGKTDKVNKERTVDVWVSRLRAKLQGFDVPYLPRTVRSFGYIFDDSLASAEAGIATQAT